MTTVDEVPEPMLHGPATPFSSPLRLPGNSWLGYHPQWLEGAPADALLRDLRHELSWHQRSIQIFGKQVLQPRLIAWAGELPYRYSGQTLEPLPRPACLRHVWASVEAFARQSFNHVLINRYRDGDDKMGWHSDDEPELGLNPLICSVSLGAARRFLVRPKRSARGGSAQPYRFELGHGSLLVMGGAIQHHYRHSLPRQAGLRSERINLTFRKLLCVPGQRPSAPHPQ